MSDASDEIQVDAPVEVEAPTEAPKGKLSVEDALQVRSFSHMSRAHIQTWPPPHRICSKS